MYEWKHSLTDFFFFFFNYFIQKKDTDFAFWVHKTNLKEYNNNNKQVHINYNQIVHPYLDFDFKYITNK